MIYGWQNVLVMTAIHINMKYVCDFRSFGGNVYIVQRNFVLKL